MNAPQVGVRALAAGLASLTLCFACSQDRGPTPAPDRSAEAHAEAPEKDTTVAAVAVHASTSATRGNERQRCEQICHTSAKLGCRKTQACETSCVAMASTRVCNQPLGAFFDCLEAQPSEHWECLEDGTAAIREGYCENEQAGFAACLQEK